MQAMSTSALGSVNGKKLARKRTPVVGSEEAAQERGEHALQVGEAHALVDQQPLDLLEHRRVRRDRDRRAGSTCPA